MVPSEHLDSLTQTLAGLLGVQAGAARLSSSVEGKHRAAVVRAGKRRMVVVWAGSGRTGPVWTAARRAEALQGRHKGAIPLVAVPFMGEAGARVCQEAGVSWVDLSGNARIVAEGLRVVVSGRPNAFKRRGRPSSAFAPKSCRVARWLLMRPDRPASQAEVARSTGVDRGLTSRTVGRLIEEGLVVRDSLGRIVVPDPALLLDAWREVYEFERHRIIRGHVAARSGDALLAKLVRQLAEQGIEHAATGLAGAWALSHFAAFRIVTIALASEPSSALLSELRFREDPRGANVWLVVPNDAGVFHGAEVHEGVRCAHPVQVYLDLKGHPERAEEAAERLRREILGRRA